MGGRVPNVIVIGSINIDHMYQGPHVVRPAESLPATRYHRAIGGKGLNQAFALQRAGMEGRLEYHGIIGYDGEWILRELQAVGFPTDHIRIAEQLETGHTVIQQEEGSEGENAVLLHYGANHGWSEASLSGVINSAQPGDWLVIQGETNLVDQTLQLARARGLTTLFNPAPYPPPAHMIQREYPSDWLIVNRLEAEAILGTPLMMMPSGRCPLEALSHLTGAPNVIITLGSRGCQARIGDCPGGDARIYTVPAPQVDAVVDTTGAGDVFLGFFLGSLLEDGDKEKQGPSTTTADPIEMALRVGCTAAALAITKLGALESVPCLEEVWQQLRRRHE